MVINKEQVIEFYVGSKKINCYSMDQWSAIPNVGDTVKISTIKGTANLQVAERLFDYVTNTFKCYCKEK